MADIIAVEKFVHGAIDYLNESLKHDSFDPEDSNEYTLKVYFIMCDARDKIVEALAKRKAGNRTTIPKVEPEVNEPLKFGNVEDSNIHFDLPEGGGR